MALRYAMLVVVLLFCAATFWGEGVHAQLDFGVGISLSIAPEHPTPGETVRVTARGSLLDLETGEVVWYVNDTKRTSGRGLSQIEVTAPPSGGVMRVKVVFMEEKFERATAEAVIRPVEIDLLWESDSYTPPFFRGRALPSAGTNLKLEAIPRFERSNGSLVPTDDIVFTWRRNGYVVAEVSGRGKSKAFLPSPPLFGTDTVSVEARSSDGTFVGTANARIPSAEPVLSLYENHPLFGITYHRALQSENFLPEVETSFAAVPYYAGAIGPNDKALLYEWRVNGNAIASAERPSEITVNAEGSTGAARIELALSHATNLFLNALGSWRVTFGTGAGGGLENPFGGTQ